MCYSHDSFTPRSGFTEISEVTDRIFEERVFSPSATFAVFVYITPTLAQRTELLKADQIWDLH
jgi:hypothetical protein